MPLTPAGLELPTEGEVLADVEAAQRAALGDSVGTGVRSPLGQLNAGLAAEARSVREDLTSAYDSLDPDLAVGAALDRICALTGTERREAIFSETQVELTLAAGASLAAGAAPQAIRRLAWRPRQALRERVLAATRVPHRQWYSLTVKRDRRSTQQGPAPRAVAARARPRRRCPRPPRLNQSSRFPIT